MTKTKIFAQRLYSEWTRDGRDQKEIAKDINMNTVTFNNYLSGRRSPNLDTVKMFADYFDCSTDYLLGKSDVRKPDEPDIQIDDPIVKEQFLKMANALNEAEKQGIITPEQKMQNSHE